ncbi:MAG TPA: amidohydrolase family protein [Mycobacteriales bacterium]|nr:amidohydrolase family protein [Mycobacteriales bacterium]
MYEVDAEKYFVVDGHCHFWDASRENWVPGQEQFAKGWIDCFYGYHQLGPPETHWDPEKYLKISADDWERDVFVDGHVDHAIFQSTYLKSWYTNGFNTAERNAELFDRLGDRITVNGRFDPRDGDAGMAELERDAATYNLKGVKLYTAEWNGDSRGYKLTTPEAYRFLQRTQELGIKNIHVHKGPTIWPLDKDAFDVADIDRAATDFPDLNFVVEHVGLPRIEDFCFMATQEPNVYAGLSVVVGGLMHARPKFFAKVMGELLFWVGEDKMIFGSDYMIWEPRWQVEGLASWQMPDDEAFSDFQRLTVASRKKILGLNAARLYDIPVPEELQLPPEAGTPAAQDDAKLVEQPVRAPA